jgi:hypothetical protein
MSSIRSIDLMFVDELVGFVRGAGYVLDFSDPSFTLFFATELDVDIDDPTYAEGGRSKGKRLRSFLLKVDNPTAVKALNALWEHRLNEGKVVGGEPVVARRHPTTLFDPVEEPLDPVTRAVERGLKQIGSLSTSRFICPSSRTLIQLEEIGRAGHRS